MQEPRTTPFEMVVGEKKKFGLTWTPWLRGAVIGTSTWQAYEGGVLLGDTAKVEFSNDSNDGERTAALTWVKAAGTYEIRNAIVTTDGQTETATWRVEVV